MTTDQTAYVEVLARLLCAADVHVYGDDHPTRQQLGAEPGRRVQDDYRKAARWLAARLTVTSQPAAPSPAVSSVGQAPATEQAAVARVRGLHQQYRFAGDDTTDYCAHCNQISGGWIPWPCPTIRALDGVEAAADAVLAVLPAPTDRAAVLREAADAVARDRQATIPLHTAWAKGNRRAEELLRRMAVEAAVPGRTTDEILPRRGDAFEAWLKAQRDTYNSHGADDRNAYDLLDNLLDHYRLHADTGTPLSEHVCEGRTVGDCDCLETAPAVGGAQQPTEDRPFIPPAHYRRDDGTDCCVHTIPVGPDSCRHCRDLADGQMTP